MAGLTAQERLQPSLLDRLTDWESTTSKEPLEAKVLNKQQLRAAVLRDLSFLFNTTRAEPDAERGDPKEVAAWKEASWARHSVLNYGIPALSGISMSRQQFARLELAFKTAILLYEPRIDPRTLSVHINHGAGFNFQHNSLRLIIKGQMWNQPVPLELLLSADVDVETGLAAVKDMRN
ncbi:MAG: type VI secretion system baseplate subunit TssE [Caldimonas sp.]